MTKQEPHKHKFDSFELVNDVADPPKKRVKQFDYAGVGTYLPALGKEVRGMAFIMRVCKCGYKEAFFYAERPVAHDYLEELNERLESKSKIVKEK